MEVVKHNLRKRAREDRGHTHSEYLAMCNDTLIDIATNIEENEALARSLPTCHSLSLISISQD